MAGSLVCVGLGMKMGAHISPVTQSYIENADVVFSLASNGIVEQWVEQMHQDVRSLQPYYEEGKSRHITYREMVAAILTEVKAGRNVVGAFYGHPGVFAYVPHRAIELAKKENYCAHMEPGISAEDCLFADLGIDPGKRGCIQYEASQFMFYRRAVDPSAVLILWQIGMAGDKSLAKYSTSGKYRQLLVKILAKNYPKDHDVILYEAAVLPISSIRVDKFPLAELPYKDVSQHTTLVIPPCEEIIENLEVLEELRALEQE